MGKAKLVDLSSIKEKQNRQVKKANFVKAYIGSRGAEFLLCWRQYFGAKFQLDTTSIASPPGQSQFISVHSLYGTIIIN